MANSANISIGVGVVLDDENAAARNYDLTVNKTAKSHLVKVLSVGTTTVTVTSDTNLIGSDVVLYNSGSEDVTVGNSGGPTTYFTLKAGKLALLQLVSGLSLWTAANTTDVEVFAVGG